MLGLTPDGTVPRTVSNEARQAGRNVANVPPGAGASLTDIVSVRQRLTKTEDVSADVAIRGELIHHERSRCSRWSQASCGRTAPLRSSDPGATRGSLNLDSLRPPARAN